MNKLYTPKIHIAIIVVTLLCTAVLYTCKKTERNISGPTPAPPDLSTTINSSVSGFVTDENNTAAANALVQFGITTTTTDKYGYFEAKNISVIKDAATVTVSKAGYFRGIKTYVAETGKNTFFRIKLMPKIIAGTISATAGGTVTLSNGLSIGLPANAIVTVTTGTAYTGTINVAAYWINPMASDLPQIMPGDLRGINSDGNIQLLTTYGMAAVELTGSGGELLQIAAGKKATLSVPIPASLTSSAASSIPLWYFDETNGLWQQQGTATKTGSNYIGEVSHFSFWNCDIPSAGFVQFNCTVVNNAAQPVQNACVKISDINNPANFRFGYTDFNGYVSGLVPGNSLLKIDILGPSICFVPVFTQLFSTTTIPVSLGNLNISINTTVTATVSGTVTNCNNVAVSNGYIIITAGNSFIRTPLTPTGSYIVTLVLCNAATLNISLFAEDITASQQSSNLNYTINAGNNIIPPVQACGVSTQQFVNYSIDNIPHGFTAPTDTISIMPHPIAPWVWLAGNKIPFSTTERVIITMSYGAIALGSNQPIYEFSCPQVATGSTVITPAYTLITEYGFVGQFIAGNFSFVMKEPAPSGILHNIAGNFRIRRIF